MQNKYAGQCAKCAADIAAGDGNLYDASRFAGRAGARAEWTLICTDKAACAARVTARQDADHATWLASREGQRVTAQKAAEALDLAASLDAHISRHPHIARWNADRTAKRSTFTMADGRVVKVSLTKQGYTLKWDDGSMIDWKSNADDVEITLRKLYRRSEGVESLAASFGH